jgi:hypothetical protein
MGGLGSAAPDAKRRALSRAERLRRVLRKAFMVDGCEGSGGCQRARGCDPFDLLVL